MTHKKGILAVSPVLVLAALFLGLGIVWGDFYKVPLVVVFLVVVVYAVAITVVMKPVQAAAPKNVAIPSAKRGFRQRIGSAVDVLSRGAGEKNLMLMIWIFLLAGAFAATAKSMGAIDATVQLTMAVMPTTMLLPGLFLAACFVSLSVGTSVGTIVALVPVAAGLAAPTGLPLPLLVASVVGGAFFGDNLSFISDTTIVATRTQGIKLADKFRANIWIAAPAAVVTFVLLFVLGHSATTPQDGALAAVSLADVNLVKVLPYIVVLVSAVAGLDVMVVLVLGNVLAGAIGMASGDLTLETWMTASADGMGGMTETILVALMAGGMMELIRHNGGIGYIIYHLTRRVHGKRGAELAIASLVSLTNCCTANNTVAILSVGKISADIADRYDVDRCKSASLLDTFSCVVQGILPYGAQLLIASGLAAITPMEIIPCLYYNVALAVMALLSIFFRFPRRLS